MMSVTNRIGDYTTAATCDNGTGDRVIRVRRHVPLCTFSGSDGPGGQAYVYLLVHHILSSVRLPTRAMTHSVSCGNQNTKRISTVQIAESTDVYVTPHSKCVREVAAPYGEPTAYEYAGTDTLRFLSYVPVFTQLHALYIRFS
jgi:hypothetical protein